MISTQTIVGITGGIGSGKSTVSRALRVMGYHVYDCDTEARRITDTSTDVRLALAERFGSDVVSSDGIVDRKALADIVFADASQLSWLNTLIHKLVYDDIKHNFLTINSEILFIESAILCRSGLDALTDRIWVVDAPTEIRIQRVMKRSGLTHEQVAARIDSQNDEVIMLKEWDFANPGCTEWIDNSGNISLIKQIINLTNTLTQNTHA